MFIFEQKYDRNFQYDSKKKLNKYLSYKTFEIKINCNLMPFTFEDRQV